MKPPPLALCALLATAPATPGADYAVVVPRLEKVIDEEMREWNLGGLAVALVDDQRVVYAAGFGEAKRDSVFRAGSISKLFNAIAIMQQVEAGQLELDAALPPEVLPLNPFAGAPTVTLRQILCHRSGWPREAPVGGYFDDSQPGLAATVASVRSCVLATRPGEKTRYSNVAPSVAGYLVERASGQAFEDYQQEHVLGPLGMTNSAWTLARVPRGQLVDAQMRVADGHGGWRRRRAPLFDVGTIPAGNLYTTAEDLARFASALLAGGAGLVKKETMEEMWRPQLTREGTGFGLGFMVERFREHRAISHNGAVYGYSASLMLLPEEKLAVVVLGNEDVATGRIHCLSGAALGLLLEAKFGEQPPAPSEPGRQSDGPGARAGAVTPGEAPRAKGDRPTRGQRPELADLAGDYESQSYWARLEARNGQLAGEVSGQPTKFTPAGESRFAAHSRLEDATPVSFERDAAGAVSGFKLGTQHFERVSTKAAPLPPEWRAFLGSYGPDFIPLVVSERHGHLYAMTENMVDYRLTPVNRNVCGLPPGMYSDEQVVFLTGADGRAHSVNFANMVLRRRE